MQIFNPNFTESPMTARQFMWQGIAWKFFSCACFASMNALVRYLSGGSPLSDEGLPIYVIIFFQNLIGSICLLPWILKEGLHTLKTSQPIQHGFRLLLALMGVSFWYLSLKYMPVAEGVALSFMSPIITVIGARIFLHEHLSFQRWVAILLTLFGAFLIARPDATLSQSNPIGWAALLPIGSACFFACSKLLTRRLAASGESTSILTAYLLFFMAPVSLIPAILSGWVTPSFFQWPFLIGMGILATLAYFSFNRAYSYAEVTFLMPFGCVKFVLSAIIGYIAFAELPKSMSTWSGILLIATCTAILGYQSSKKKPAF